MPEPHRPNPLPLSHGWARGVKHLTSIAAAGMVMAAGWLALAADKLEGTSKGLSPLKVDRTAPMLLDEPPAKKQTSADPKKPMADNSACFVCHGNFQEESMVAVHAKENVSCAKCHGASLEHRNDENNITAPEKMYTQAQIDNACRQCHEEHNASARKVITMFQARFPQNIDPKKVLCTDCHGEHRLKVRSVYWDKSTGKLLGRNPEATEKSGVGKKKLAEEKP